MGKLHTLKRAIKRDPQKWVGNWGVGTGANFVDGQWNPYSSSPYSLSWRRFGHPYQAFVRHTLKELGYDVGQGR